MRDQRVTGRKSRTCAVAVGLVVLAAAFPSAASVADAALLQAPKQAVVDDVELGPGGWTVRPNPALSVDRRTLPKAWSFVAAPRESGSHAATGTLGWRSPTPLPAGDAGVEFWLGRTFLGVPRPHHDNVSFSLSTESLPRPDLTKLRVMSAGTRVDRRTSTRGQTATGVSRPAGAERLVERELQTRRAAAVLPHRDDPGTVGPFSVVSQSYELPGFSYPQFKAPIEMVGRVVRPVGMAEPGPLVLMLHGRHSTCYKGSRSSIDWPCREGWSPIPSHLGYLDTQRLLASQGYVTVSISANGINGQDWRVADGGAGARSKLVRRHLKQFARWNAAASGPFGSQLVGKIDIQHVVLMGHSRGGEGVNRAVIDSDPGDPWRLVGQVLIGPTDFGRQVAVGTPTVALLPFCDGDVGDLQGQQYIDQSRDIARDQGAAAALRSSVMVLGANHNFFNAQWTPGLARAPSYDDWGDRSDPVCGRDSELRLTSAEQRQVGSTYVAAAVDMFVDRSRDSLALLDGSSVRASSVGPAVVHSTALGAARAIAYRPRAQDQVRGTRATTTRICAGWGRPRSAVCTQRQSPHFLPMSWNSAEPAPDVWEVGWTRSSGRARVRLHANVDLSAASQLELRVAALPGHPPAKFVVRLIDGKGRSTDLPEAVVRPLPSSRSVSNVWARAVRLPLGRSRIDLSDIQQVVVVPTSAQGKIWVLDAHGRSDGVPVVSPANLPRLDVFDQQVTEGDGGPRTISMPIELTGAVARPVKFWVAVGGDRRTTSSVITVSPGDSSVEVPITIDADQRDDFDLNYSVVLKALRNVVTGHYFGTLTVLDDDPTPAIVVTSHGPVPEGGRLRWDLTFDARTDVWSYFRFNPTAPMDGAVELMSNDVDLDWLRRCGRVPKHPKLLSDMHLRCLSAELFGDEPQATLAIPTRLDRRSEGGEQVALKIVDAFPADFDPYLRLRGKVLNSPWAPR